MSSFFLRQTQAIQKGGFPELKRKLERFLSLAGKGMVLLINGIWAIPAALVMRALRPWLVIRIGTLCTIRIGHFIDEAVGHKACLEKKSQNIINWFFLPSKTCNRQWEKMVRRELPVYDCTKYLFDWNSLLSGKGNEYEINQNSMNQRVITNLYQHHDVKFSFKKNEEMDAKKWLMTSGWKEGEPFVCLMVRDDAYLANHSLHGRGDEASRKKWSYHSYRDSDIDTYVPAMEWLADQGVWILRMGKIMNKQLRSAHPRIIDYAFCNNKSDLLDIWLFANCNFCISTGTGMDTACIVYRRPILYLNCAPLICLNNYSQSTWVNKSIYWIKSGKPLRLKEYLEHSYLRSEEYRRVGVVFRDLNAEEILTYTQEFWQRIQGTWQETEEDLKLHLRFWKTLESCEDYTKVREWRHPESRVATMWLRQQSEGFFD